MFPQTGVFELVKNRKINLIGNRRFIKPVRDTAKDIDVEHIPHEGQINIGTMLEISLGARTLQNRFFHHGELNKYPPNDSHGFVGKSESGHDYSSFSNVHGVP